MLGRTCLENVDLFFIFVDSYYQNVYFFTQTVLLLFSVHDSLKVIKSVVGFHIFLVWNFWIKQYFYIFLNICVFSILDYCFGCLKASMFLYSVYNWIWCHIFTFSRHLLTLNHDLLLTLLPFVCMWNLPWASWLFVSCTIL